MKWSDNTIIQGVLSKDERAFEILYETYFHKLYNYVFLKVGNRETAEKITEEVFNEVLCTLDQCYGTSSLSRWFFKITRKQMSRLSAETQESDRELRKEAPERYNDFLRLEKTVLRHFRAETVLGG